MTPGKLRWITWCLRVTLSAAFLSAVADRFGLWGPPGAAHVSWGDFAHFIEYTGRVNSFVPRAFIPLLAWLATIAELLLGIWLLTGIALRWAAYLSSALLFAFAAAMTLSFSIKSPLDYSVFTAAAAALALGALSETNKEQLCRND
jgi:uncharacterized membrane protein YphA (DoxX/SURF4 family)